MDTSSINEQTTTHSNGEVMNQTESAPPGACASHQKVRSRTEGGHSKNAPAYEVGYGRPPKATQFKPGQSGNPSGRPKDRKTLRDELGDFYEQQVPITMDGEAFSVSRLEALLLKQISHGMQGNDRALQNAITNAKSFALLNRSYDIDALMRTVMLAEDEEMEAGDGRVQ